MITGPQKLTVLCDFLFVCPVMRKTMELMKSRCLSALCVHQQVFIITLDLTVSGSALLGKC